MANRCDLTGVQAMTGNNVSHSNRKTKRRFMPNLQNVKLKSDSLGINIQLSIAMKTLRTVNKYGNLDNFLINYRFAKLTDKGIKLRKKVEKALINKGLYDTMKITSRKVIKINN